MLEECTVAMENPNFWDDPSSAQKVVEEANQLKEVLQPWGEADQAITFADEMLGAVGDDPALLQELQESLEHAQEQIHRLEVKRMLCGEFDRLGCFFSINAGAGGSEACDWVAMLSRMYTRWMQSKGWKVTLIDALDGDVAGFRHVTYQVDATYAYGYCRSERGVHRLVRISPFDTNNRRHTSFASVEVTPQIDATIEVELKQEELRIDTYRASGAGGQHVNKTDSAVRITHLPSGIVVSCQSERSQIQNKESCMKALRSKLFAIEQEKKQALLANLSGEKKEIGWGSQIRSYVFQPYTLVTDTRTNVKIGAVQSVMDGGIDTFVEAYLKQFGAA